MQDRIPVDQEHPSSVVTVAIFREFTWFDGRNVLVLDEFHWFDHLRFIAR